VLTSFEEIQGRGPSGPETVSLSLSLSLSLCVYVCVCFVLFF